MNSSKCKIATVGLLLSGLLIFAAPSAFADGPSTLGSSAPSAVNLVQPPCGTTGVLVYEVPMKYAGVIYGETELFYNSCNREVKATAFLTGTFIPGDTLQACLQTSTEAQSGVVESCGTIFSGGAGTSVSTGWFNDANILTRASGNYAIVVNNQFENAISYTPYY